MNFIKGVKLSICTGRLGNKERDGRNYSKVKQHFVLNARVSGKGLEFAWRNCGLCY